MCLWLVMAGLMMTGCSDDESAGNVKITTNSTVELYPVVNQSGEVKFETSGSWKASCKANWITFSPKNGTAGNNVITVTTTSTNRSKNTRTTQLTIESDGTTKNVTIKQSGDYAVFEHDELNFSSDGGSLNENFWSNLDKDHLYVYATNGLDEWINSKDNNARTRQEYKYSFNDLRVRPNTSKDRCFLPRDERQAGQRAQPGYALHLSGGHGRRLSLHRLLERRKGGAAEQGHRGQGHPNRADGRWLRRRGYRQWPLCAHHEPGDGEHLQRGTDEIAERLFQRLSGDGRVV